MKYIIFICFLSILFQNINGIPRNTILRTNNRPIIGILSHELTINQRLHYPGKCSYIAASYVKFIEGAGGRVVPIPIGKTKSYYESLLNKINGILIPDGLASFDETSNYCRSGEKIFKIAIDMNDRDSYIPILGINLGFHILMYLSAEKIDITSQCNSENLNVPLTFESNLQYSKLYQNIPLNILEILKTKNSTTDNGSSCITKASFKQTELNKKWRILSQSYDRDDNEFISSIEHRTYPFYGIQFHPEKNIYEFTKNHEINHEPDTILASQYFANFFVNECRKNLNSFNSNAIEKDNLIYNYSPKFTANKFNSMFAQSYFFDC